MIVDCGGISLVTRSRSTVSLLAKVEGGKADSSADHPFVAASGTEEGNCLANLTQLHRLGSTPPWLLVGRLRKTRCDSVQMTVEMYLDPNPGSSS
jgi:hypothetical protein